MRYRVVYLVESRSFKCSVFLFLCDLRLSETIKVDLILSYLNAKRAFYRAANSIFWNNRQNILGRSDLSLQLIKSKCIPILIYGLELCALDKSEIASLDFVINRFFVKLFQTNNIEIVRACQEFFGFELPNALLPKRVKNFENRFCNMSELNCIICH